MKLQQKPPLLLERTPQCTLAGVGMTKQCGISTPSKSVGEVLGTPLLLADVATKSPVAYVSQLAFTARPSAR